MQTFPVLTTSHQVLILMWSSCILIYYRDLYLALHVFVYTISPDWIFANKFSRKRWVNFSRLPGYQQWNSAASKRGVSNFDGLAVTSWVWMHLCAVLMRRAKILQCIKDKRSTFVPNLSSYIKICQTLDQISCKCFVVSIYFISTPTITAKMLW